MPYRHLWAITRKEVQHIFRNRTTFFLVILAPTIMLFIMAYSLTVEIKDVPIAVLDYDRSATSRRFIKQITAGEDLRFYAQAASMGEIEDMLMRGQIKAARVIDPDFARDLQAMRGVPLQVIIDGTEPQSGGFAVDQINWRVSKVRDGDIVFTREDPAQPGIPPASRVIALRTDEQTRDRL